MSSARVFMGNLPSEARDKDIEHFFRGYGKIIDIQRKEGYAIVVLSHPRDADEAISDLNGKTLLNNRINVEKTYGSKKREKFESRRPVHRFERKQVIRTSHRVFIRNLSSRVSWQDLKDYMSTVSQPTFADAHKKFKNEGMVEFSTYEDMNRAIAKLDGTELNGRVIRMVPDDRTRSGRQSSPEYNRYTKRKRSKSPAVSRRGYERESRPSRRFRSKERSSRVMKRPHSRSVHNNLSRRRPRTQSGSPSRSVEQQTFRSRSRSASFRRPKSPLGSPVPLSKFSRSRSGSVEPQAARSPSVQRPKSPSRSRSRSTSGQSRSQSKSIERQTFRSRSRSTSFQRPKSPLGSPVPLSKHSRPRSKSQSRPGSVEPQTARSPSVQRPKSPSGSSLQSRSRSRSRSTSEPDSKRAKH